MTCCANCGREHPPIHSEDECQWFRIRRSTGNGTLGEVLRYCCSERCLAQHPPGAW